MFDFRRMQFVRRAAGSAHPSTLLTLATAAVFSLSLGLAWMTSAEAQDCAGGADWCLLTPAQNPCNIFTSCQATGPGYECTVMGDPNPKTEGTYKVSPYRPWQMCTSPATTSTMSCTAQWAGCGVMYHFVSGYNACEKYCTGSWYWMACWGTGNKC
jgi:hypothetical protein